MLKANYFFRPTYALFSKKLLLIPGLLLGLLLFSQPVIGQCSNSPAVCQPNMVRGHGPDPCIAKMYCSNSGKVETGLIDCTSAADTDGCGIDASADAVYNIANLLYSSADASVTDLFSGACPTGNYLQWMVLATPPFVKGTKIQAVGAVDSWWLFHAGSFTVGTDSGDFPSVFDALSEDARCDAFGAAGLITCTDKNQWVEWSNDAAVIGEGVYNVYYVALFYGAPTNGSLNFKVKECEIVNCSPFVTECPTENVEEAACQTQVDIDESFGEFLDDFSASGEAGQNPVITWELNGVVQGGKPTVADAPDACGGIVTVQYTIEDDCNIDIVCEWKFTVTEDKVLPVISTDDATKDLGCNPTVTAPIFTGLDNCDGVFIPEVAEGVKTLTSGTSECMTYSQTWTATYTDACSNVAVPVSITYIWKEDSDAPDQRDCFNETMTLKTSKGAVCPADADISLAIGEEISINDKEWKVAGIPISEIGTLEPCFRDACTATEDLIFKVIGKTNTATECPNTLTVTFDVYDLCGNAFENFVCTFIIEDDIAPTIAIVSNDDPAGACNPIIVPPTFTVSDNCKAEDLPVTAMTSGATNDGCDWTQTWTADYADACDNEAVQLSVTYTWTVDTEKPSITVPVSATKPLGCNPSEFSFDEPGFDGGCSDVVAIDGYPMKGEVKNVDECARSLTKTWQVTDCSQLVTEVRQTLTWFEDEDDITAPTVKVPVNATKVLGCNPAEFPFDEPEFDGGCGDVVAIDGYPMIDDVINIDECARSRTKTWQVTDCSELVTEVSQTLTWTEDTEKPSITVSVNATKALGCNPSEFPFDVPGFDGGCSNVVAIDGYPIIGDVINVDECARSRTKTWQVTDCSQLVTEVRQTLTWEYVPTPVTCSISVDPDNDCSGADVTLVANGSVASGPYTYLWSTKAKTQSITVGVGTYYVTVTDGCGCSSAVCSYTVKEDCGTAWAWENDGNSRCLDDLRGEGCGREADRFQWGFTTYVTKGTQPEFTLYQGAPGKCKGKGSTGTPVGDISITWDGEDPVIEINLYSEYYTSEIHLWIGDNPLPINKRDKCVAAPGQFNKLGGCAYSPDKVSTYTIDDCAVSGPSAWIAIHVVACNLVCGDEKGFKTTKKNFVSTEQDLLDSADLKISPNPSIDRVNVQFEATKAQNMDLQIFDLNGRIVQQRIYGAVKGMNSIELDVQFLQNGIFLMALTSEDGNRKVKKFIKLDR